MSNPRHQIFHALHQRGNPFVLVNVWDVGTARMMEALGAQAIATSSAAFAYTLGKVDGTLTREEALNHAEQLVRVVNVPVSADLENGYSNTPEGVAETVRLAAEVGLSGVSIEDTCLPTDTAYPFDVAVERIGAAAEAVRALKRDFVLVARADGLMTGAYDCDEAMRRCAAFERVGANCLYAPLLPFAELATFCASTACPINALVADENTQRTREEFAAIGVARLSLGSSLARVTHRLIHDAGKAMLDAGDFSVLKDTIAADVVDTLMTQVPYDRNC